MVFTKRGNMKRKEKSAVLMDKFPYHRQNSANSCGPACAQMVIDFMTGGSLVPKTQDEVDSVSSDTPAPSSNDLWQLYIQDKWITRPDVLQFGLNQYAKGQSSNQLGQSVFSAYYRGIPEDYKFLLSDDAIENTVYPIVPVHGTFYYKDQIDDFVEANGYSGKVVGYDTKSKYDAHWIVLFKYENNGFMGNDPYFPLSEGDNPHKTSDNCKPVLIHINGNVDSIRDINFPDINRVAVFWSAAPNSGARLRPPTKPPLFKSPLLARPPLPAREVNRKITKFVDREVKAKMDSFGLFTRPPCQSYLAGTNFGTPRRVHRLDVLSQDYYLVPRLKPNGDSTAMVRIDVPTGEYLDSLYYSENPFLFDKSPAQQRLVQTIIPQRLTKLRKSKWKQPFAEQINDPETEMVWLPCQQSQSAFFPFYVIKMKNERLFVRVDGQIFPKLTY